MNIYELKEKSLHGTKEFPIQVYHPIGLMASYHWHEECEFIYMNSGSALIRLGAESFELKEGECAYIKAGALHSITMEDNVPFDFYAIVFHPSLLTGEMDICSKYLSTKYVIMEHFIPRPREIEVIETVKLLCLVFEAKAFAYELKIKSCLYSIFSCIFEYGFFREEDYVENKKLTQKLEKVIRYIHMNYRSSLTIQELAAVSGYSISHFTRFFKELTGKTPVEYIIRQRIYSSCDLLKHTGLSVLEVSLECGFDNVGYFIKTFKKYMNCTPYQYKRKSEQIFRS